MPPVLSSYSSFCLHLGPVQLCKNSMNTVVAPWQLLNGAEIVFQKSACLSMHVWLWREQKVIQLLINLEYSLYTMLEKHKISRWQKSNTTHFYSVNCARRDVLRLQYLRNYVMNSKEMFSKKQCCLTENLRKNICFGWNFMQYTHLHFLQVVRRQKAFWLQHLLFLLVLDYLTVQNHLTVLFTL